MGIADADNISQAPTGQVARIREWSADEFVAASRPWNDLLARSGANPLFMSWEWQWNWWRSQPPRLERELLLLAGYDSSDRLVGLAPMYLHRGNHRGMFAMRLESLGSCWRSGANVFSEYLDFIVDHGYEKSFLDRVGDALLADSRWSDLVFCNTRPDGFAARVIRDRLGDVSYVRSADPMVAHVAMLPERFDEYVRSLDRSTRRRVWNHRRKIAGAQLDEIDVGRIESVLDQLDSFHLRRWGRAHYVGVRRAFHERFATAMSRLGNLRMSELRREDGTLSIMYNVRIGSTEYNVQSGFDSLASRGISPGYLHFGFCIERALDEGVRRFDFLAGPGRHREYKQDFRTAQTRLVTLQSIRARSLAWLYRQYDKRFASLGDSHQAGLLPLAALIGA
jgi:hypothetical protein